jgi:hypothetical protein
VYWEFLFSRIGLPACFTDLFAMNLLLYGEGGERAFVRLQEEIMKDSDDQTIFAWKTYDAEQQLLGLLARSPARFMESGSIVADHDWRYGL